MWKDRQVRMALGWVALFSGGASVGLLMELPGWGCAVLGSAVLCIVVGAVSYSVGYRGR